ncbi:MAG: glycosyltransferase [Gaiellaceae bacterium]
MRILHVIQEMAVGGAERVVAALAHRSGEEGHEVALAAVPGRLSDDLGLPLFALPLVERRPLQVAPAARRLAGAVRAWKPDVVHSHNPGMAIVTGLATRRGRRPPALVSVHGVPEDDYRRAAWLLRLAGLQVVACGPGVAAGLAERGCRVERTIVNGVAPAPDPLPRAELVRRFGLSESGNIVAAVGRLVPQKNHVLAVRALREVPDTTLLVFGEGDLRGEIELEAQAAGVADRVVLPGLQPDARAALAAVDALVLTSHWEGLPLAVLEALAAGVPVVATAVRGVRELLTDRQDGLLVPPGDASALAGALRSVLGDAGLARRLATAGSELAARHSEEAMAAEYLALYGKLTRRG